MTAITLVGSRPTARPDVKILAHLLSLEPLGGVELCILQDTNALGARGHEFEILYGADGALRSSYENAHVGLKGPYGFALDSRRLPQSIAGYLPAARTVRRSKVDVVWLNRFEHILWGQTVARWANRPLVCHLHGIPMFKKVRQLSFGVSRFIAVSEYIRDSWVDAGLAPEKITVVQNAVPAELYPCGGLEQRAEARRKLGLPLDVPIVLCYGQVSAAKGLPDLIQAWRHVRGRREDGLLVVVGTPSPEDDPEIKAQWDQADPSTVRFFPHAADVVPFLHASDLVAFPTRLDEAFGRVVIEGMSTGRPVIASAIGAIPEILSGAMSQFLFAPRSPEHLARTLESMLEWRSDRPELARECANWVRTRYPFEAHVDALENVLASSLPRDRAS
jgi:glycosyltransferase involved in cell wall biosynthesis